MRAGPRRAAAAAMTSQRPPPPRTSRARAIGTRLVVWLAVAGALVLGLRALLLSALFHPEHASDPRDEPAARALGAVPVAYAAEDGVRLVGWWLQAAAGAEGPVPGGRAVVVAFHGNAETAAGRVPWARALADAGVDVLLAEYRGYGGSGGSPTPRGVERDADAAVRHVLRDRGLPAARLAVHGRSLGGAAALHALSGSARDAAAGVVASSFTSLLDMSRVALGGLPLGHLVPDAYALDSLGRAPRVRAPVLLLHGDADEVVPFSQAERLHAALPRAAPLRRIHGGTHNDLDPAAEADARAFLLRALAAHEPPAP
jgi:fermentation-respiration switch protein FrsA (DUF1100 family)